jgi:hypothetical protein
VTIGDLVRVHWGNCSWSGTEGVDWGYGVGVVTGDIVWWENTRRLVSPCGDVEILFRGERVNYNLGRLEIVNESR